jgi:hypothetical protein
MSDGGKGSSPRPFSVDDQTFSNNWDTIFAKKKPADFQDVLSTEECVLSALEAEDRISRYNEETQTVKNLK